MKAETCVRYHGLQDMIASKMVKTLKSMETNAKNVFDEVGKHLDSPEAVIAALESKTSLAPDVRGYFAAFEPEYFPEKGRWFEPYVHQYADSSDFVLSMVGSARHDYTRSAWYVKAKELQTGFWSDPYFYYDGTGIGLTVARSLARRIGGDIMLDTAYIGGSRFVMTLPIDAV
jgi:hypothetical protein